MSVKLPIVGKSAPSFSLADQNGDLISLSKLRHDFIVLYFYPKDDTPGCTIETTEFSKAKGAFARRDTLVLGLSGGDVRSKRKFCDKYDLDITLLADEECSVAKKYGVYGKKSFMGRTFQGIRRTTFVLDGSRKVLRVFESVSPKGHADEVLTYIDHVSRASKGLTKPRVRVVSTKVSMKKSAAASKRKVRTRSALSAVKGRRKTAGRGARTSRIRR